MKPLWWDYVCDRCNEVGSCPLDASVSLSDALVSLAEAHGQFNPDCGRKHQGRWLRVLRVEPGDEE